MAHRLAREGLQVTVIERGRPGGEASSAAAGMLAPQSEAAHGLSGRFSELCLASRHLYPDFVAELENETGINIGYHTTGSIFVASDYAEAAALAGLLERQQAAGQPAEELTAQQVRELEPELAETIEVGVYLPSDHYVDNRRLMTALVAAAARRGVEFLTETPVVGLEFDGPRVIGVRLPEQILTAGHTINAAGSWAGLIDQTGRLRLPVRPVRGQQSFETQQQGHVIHLGQIRRDFPVVGSVASAIFEATGHLSNLHENGTFGFAGDATNFMIGQISPFQVLPDERRQQRDRSASIHDGPVRSRPTRWRLEPHVREQADDLDTRNLLFQRWAGN